jgi:hypothetical protein
MLTGLPSVREPARKLQKEISKDGMGLHDTHVTKTPFQRLNARGRMGSQTNRVTCGSRPIRACQFQIRDLFSSHILLFISHHLFCCIMAMAAPIPLRPEEVSIDLTCSICLSVPSKPVLTPCEHLFCKECLCRAVSHQPLCPICRKGCVRGQIRPIPEGSFVYRMWSSIPVKCELHEKGCCWTGSIVDAVEHMDKCQHGGRKRGNTDLNRLCERRAELESDHELLRRHIETLQSELSGVERSNPHVIPRGEDPPDHNFRLDDVAQLSQLISRHLYDKPRNVGASQIFESVRNCHVARNQQNTKDVRMLLATCAASNWFTSRQNEVMQTWLSDTLTQKGEICIYASPRARTQEVHLKS